MQIKKIQAQENASSLTIALEGRLDTASAPNLEETLENSMSGVSALEIDLAGVEHISSAGLRVLLSTQKRMNKQGRMTVKNVNAGVLEILEMTGFTKILTIVK
jgi:anti-sigma B factor antagonist